MPRRRASERVTVARMMQTTIHDTPRARPKIDAASYLLPTPSNASAANAASIRGGKASHQSRIVDSGSTKVQNASTAENHNLSLGNRPGEANLWRRKESRGITVSIDSRIEMAHLISSQSNGEYIERSSEELPSGRLSSHEVINESLT